MGDEKRTVKLIGYRPKSPGRSCASIQRPECQNSGISTRLLACLLNHDSETRGAPVPADGSNAYRALRSRHQLIQPGAMSTDAERLSRWRTLGARHSEDVLELAPRVLRSSGLGDQGELRQHLTRQTVTQRAEWAVREQLAIAALDLGRISTATVSHSVKVPRE